MNEFAASLLGLIGVQCTGAPAAGLDWDALDRSAEAHRLQPLLHHQQGGSDAVPPALRERWAAAYRASAVRTLAQAADRDHCLAVLRSAGIDPVALKGAWLAHHAYEHPALRPMRDLDLLVDPAHAATAFALLVEAGYRRDPEDTSVVEDHLRNDKQLPSLQAPHGTWIELHHALVMPAGTLDHRSPSLDAAGMVARSAIADDGVRYPAPADMLAHLIVHAAYGHRFDCGPQVLVDIDMLLRRHRADWPALWTRAAVEGWTAGARVVLTLAARYRRVAVDFGTAGTAPAEVADAAARLMVQDPASREDIHALARLQRRGLGDAGRRAVHTVAGPKRDWTRVAARLPAVLRALFDPAMRRGAREMARLSSWFDAN